MYEVLVAAAIFFCLVVASLGSLVVSERLPAHYRQDDTHNVVRLAANIFVVTTSLMLGLLLNSSKNTFEAVDRNVHAFATDLILLDRILRHYGPEASDVRQRLAAYVRQALDGTWGADGSRVLDDRVAERLLDEVGNALMAIRPSDPVRAELWREAQINLQHVVKRRWALIEESEGTIPAAFLVMLTAWLVLIFRELWISSGEECSGGDNSRCGSVSDCRIHLPDTRHGCAVCRLDSNFPCALAAGRRATAQVKARPAIAGRMGH